MKKNNKKHLPLLLLALLMISVGAYGTRAYFTDSVEEKVGIQLTLGDLEIKSTSEDSWTYSGDNVLLTGVEKIDFTTTESFPVVQPGDSFSRKFKFENNGSLIQKVKITNDVFVGEESPFVVSYKVEDDIGNPKTFTEETAKAFIKDLVLELDPKDTIEATMIITVRNDTNMDNNANNKYNTNSKNAENNNTQDFVLNLLENSIKVEAKQTNDSSKPN